MSEQKVELGGLRNIDARIVLSSVNPAGDRLVTVLFRFPRWLHSELMTHRAFSRNAASSRAIPVHKILEMVTETPAMPEYWGGEKPGMQSGAHLDEGATGMCKHIWKHAASLTVECARDLLDRGLHKSLVNRLLEPWMPYTVLVSATSWDNFFALRAHKDAMPEFQILAYRMLDQYLKCETQQLDWGQWHIPFGDQMPEGLDELTRLKVATARCARLSYLTYDGEMNVAKDLELYHRLMEAAPLHASPAEHPARAMPSMYLHSEHAHPSEFHCEVNTTKKIGAANTWRLPYDPDMVHQGNFQGWTQLRKLQANECVDKADLHGILAGKPDWIKL